MEAEAEACSIVAFSAQPLPAGHRTVVAAAELWAGLLEAGSWYGGCRLNLQRRIAVFNEIKVISMC